MTPAYDFPRPALTVDVAVLDRKGRRVLLVRRGQEPFLGRWALPGGYVEEMEPLELAARRELAEETGVRVGAIEQLATFGDPGRDPRGWTVTVAWLAFADSETTPCDGGDDAEEAAWHGLDGLPPLAFDHGLIIATALERAGVR